MRTLGFVTVGGLAIIAGVSGIIFSTCSKEKNKGNIYQEIEREPGPVKKAIFSEGKGIDNVTLTWKPTEIRIERGNGRDYTDTERDGSLDKISGTYERGCGGQETLQGQDRNIDYHLHARAFEQAQRDYDEQIRRFKPLLEENNLWPPFR